MPVKGDAQVDGMSNGTLVGTDYDKLRSEIVAILKSRQLDSLSCAKLGKRTLCPFFVVLCRALVSVIAALALLHGKYDLCAF